MIWRKCATGRAKRVAKHAFWRTGFIENPSLIRIHSTPEKPLFGCLAHCDLLVVVLYHSLASTKKTMKSTTTCGFCMALGGGAEEVETILCSNDGKETADKDDIVDRSPSMLDRGPSPALESIPEGSKEKSDDEVE